MAVDPIQPEVPPSERPTVSRVPERAGTGSPSESGLAQQMIGPYRVVRRLASGGMGDVYECRDDQLGRSVAVKVARAELASNAALMELVRDEGRRLASVKRTSYVARVLAASDTIIDGVSVPYIAMEFEENAEVLGGPISNAWPLGKKVEVFVLVCRAVEALHEQHLVHADIKPSNILIVGDEPRLIDFGIARVVRQLGGEPGQLLAGTPGYLDPSLAGSGRRMPDQLSDVYALGVTLAVFLTGRSPGEVGIGGAWPTREHPASRECPTIDAELDGLILRAVDPERRHRFQSVSALRERLERWSQAHVSPAARASRAMARARDAVSRAAVRRPLVCVLGVGTIAAVVAMALSPVLFGWTGVARATQPLEKGASVAAPRPREVRLIEMRDAAATIAAMGPSGAEIPLGAAGAERLVWARLALKIAAAGGSRAVAFDLIFHGEPTPFDAALRDALADLANATESRRVLVGLERWDDRPYVSISPGPPIYSACVAINKAESGLPPTLQLAVAHAGRATLEPSFALALAAMTLHPGAEFRVDIEPERGAVRLTFERAGTAGAREEFSGRLILEGLSVEPPNDAEQSVNGVVASDRMVRFPAALASDVDLAAVSKDASEVFAMSAEELRGWILGRTLILCDARDGRDTLFRGMQGMRPGARFQACAVESLIAREYLRQPSEVQAGLLTWAAAFVAAAAGWMVGGVLRPRNRVGGVGLTCTVAVLVAGIIAGGALWAGGASGYLVNPMVVAIGAFLACALVASVRRRALAAESA